MAIKKPREPREKLLDIPNTYKFQSPISVQCCRSIPKWCICHPGTKRGHRYPRVILASSTGHATSPAQTRHRQTLQICSRLPCFRLVSRGWYCHLSQEGGARGSVRKLVWLPQLTCFLGGYLIVIYLPSPAEARHSAIVSQHSENGVH